jgi:iron complex outermembrane recepter protein
VNSEQDTERRGATLTLQWSPNENTDISLDTLYSNFDVERRDNYIAALSFGRNVNNNGQPMVSVRDISFDSNGSLIHGVFDGVDVRSEGLVDRFETAFRQVNLNLDHRISDRLRITGLAGYSETQYDGKLRLQTFIDAIDTDNFTLDFRNGHVPVVGFGIDVADPAEFAYALPRSDGTVLGGFSTAGRPSTNLTKNTTFNLNGEWTFNDALAVTLGGQYRESDFSAKSMNVIPSQTAVQPLPAGMVLTDITRNITGVDDLFGGGAPASWLAVDMNKWARAFGFDSFQFCGIECGAARSQIVEQVQSGFMMLNFDTGDLLPIPVRGDVGMRYVHTDQLAVGYIPVTAPAGSPYPSVGQRNEVERSYEDWLPSLNVVLEFTPDLLGRLSASKVMTRPELGVLAPTSGVNGITRTGTVNNPFLDPIRAKTFDAAVEWYFRPGSLLSLAFFYKDIDTYIQRVTSQIPFNELGLPPSLIDNTAALPTDIFTVSRSTNTPGGPLEGLELNAQLQFDFLPGLWRDFGLLANYTYVSSEIEYVLATASDGSFVTATDDLVGLSRDSASTTLYYENQRFSIRTTGSYRSKYIRGIPASPGSDVRANKSTIYVDASASYNFSDHLMLIVEAQNLTDERNTLYIDSVREDTLFETRIGRTYTVGATYKF